MSRGAAAKRNRRARRAGQRDGQGVSKALTATGQVVAEAVANIEAFAALRERARAVDGIEAFADDFAPVLLESVSPMPGLLAAAGIVSEPRDPIVTTYELTAGPLSIRRFKAEALLSGHGDVRSASWPCEGKLEDHGDVLFRENDSAVYRLDDGTLVYAHLGHGWFEIQVAAKGRETIADTLAAFNTAYPPLYREADSTTVPITFWTLGRFGPTSRLRMIEAASWEQIEGNYTAAVKAELARLMGDFEPGKDGQLLLWQGPPGTGKTWALRALASMWRDWAEFHYITDPDAFFVHDPSYMIDVLLSDTYEEYDAPTPDGTAEVVTSVKDGGKWRVLILEDTGELLSANSKEAYGQGVSRLLNVVDGMVGQGLRVLALVTTNDELGELHPAVVRPGRCAAQLTFDPLTAEEANVWLAAQDDTDVLETDSPATLAELYALRGQPAAAFQVEGECTCGHMADDHLGGEGPCSATDCDCDAFEQTEVTAEKAAALASLESTRWIIGDPAASDVVRMTLNFDTKLGTYSTTTETEIPAGTTLELALPEAVETLPPPNPSVVLPEVAPSAGTAKRWQGTLTLEGTLTEDGRAFAPGSITWRDLPLTLSAMLETQEGHDGAKVCGRIDRIWRDGNLVRAEGVFDSGEFGEEIARLVSDQTLRGVSVDIAVLEADAVPRSDYFDEEGNWLGDDARPEPVERDPVDVLFGEPDEPIIHVIWKAVIGMTTVCPFPAFADAEISMLSALVWRMTVQGGITVVADRSAGPETAGEALVDPLARVVLDTLEAVTAAAAGLAPVEPPADWFDDPQLDELTALTIDDDGRVYGHAAPWGVCHIGLPGVCKTAPHSRTDYAKFHLKEVRCEGGERVAVGTITLDAPHASHRAGLLEATAHYDHTGTAVADVVCGEDEFGIWVAGALRSDADEMKVRKLRGAVLSGDWRDLEGNLELVALLAVNVPGFPVPRTRALVAAADGGLRVLSLTAAGVHMGEPDDPVLRERLHVLRDQANGEYAALARRAA